jgi:anti-sigma-K factor RskA
MSMMHVTDLIPAYALDILDQAEKEGVAAHLDRCVACQMELRAYRAVVEILPDTLPPRDPPLRLRAAILQKAAEQEILAQSKRSNGWAWLTRPLKPVVGLVGLVLIMALAGLNLSLWQQVQHPAMAPVPTSVPSDFHLVRMTAPQNGTATGLLVISDEGNFGTLVVDGLTTLDAAQQYQLWLVKDGKRTSGGVFSVLDTGYGVLKIDSPMPLIQYQSFGITIEPAGGSPGPTGPKVLGGSL